MKKSFVLYLDQYNKQIQSLSLEQKGKLFDAMFLYNCGEEINLNDPVLDMAFSFFEETFKRDTDKWLRKAEANRENGKKGGRPKKNENSDLGKTHQNPKNPDGFTETQQNPQKPKKAVSVSGSVSGTLVSVQDNILSEFEIFWNAFDKKKDREKCFTKWKNLKKSERESALESVYLYVQSTQDKQYRKNPLTWLNGKCWNDDIEEYKKPGTMKKTGFTKDYYKPSSTGDQNEFF